MYNTISVKIRCRFYELPSYIPYRLRCQVAGFNPWPECLDYKAQMPTVRSFQFKTIQELNDMVFPTIACRCFR